MALRDIKATYKTFFVDSEPGRDLLQQIEDKLESNRKQAENSSEMKYLDRAKGNREVLELIQNVLNSQEVKRK